MRRLTFLAISALVLMAGLAGTASAAPPKTPTSGVHFTQAGDPSCTLTNGAADCDAELAGLGQGDIVVLTTVQAFATYTCQNRGGNQAPGQNKVPGPRVGSGEPTVIPGAQIENGRATVSDSAGPATVSPTVSGQQAGCPNGNWTGVDPQIVGYFVHFEASQGGVLLFCREGESDTASGGVALTTDCGGVAR